MHIQFPNSNEHTYLPREESVKTTRMIKKMCCYGFAAAMIALPVHGATEEQPVPKEQGSVERQQQESRWNEAGKDVKEAAGSVTEATKETAGTAWDTLKTESAETWEKTKAGSRELIDTVETTSKKTWQATKEGSRDLWQKGKAKIHEATAPDPPVSPAPPTKPAAEPPAAPAAPSPAARQ